MIFGNNYYSALDRNYYVEPENNNTLMVEEGGAPAVPVMGIKEIGQTIIDGRQQGTFAQTVERAIRQGAGRLEMQPAMEGQELGSGVESYGKELREDIRALAKLNKTDLQSVHTPVQIGNVAGLGEQGYSEGQRENQINEIKKHIDFAADVANGGSIVIHTGEFPRGLASKYGKQGKYKFELYPGEKREEVFYLVDDRSGQIVKTVRADQQVVMPKWLRADRDYVDPDGKQVKKNEYIDYEGKKVTDYAKRVPVYNPKDGTFETQTLGWKEITEDANEWNAANPDQVRKPEEHFWKVQAEAQQKSAEGWARYYSREFETLQKGLADLTKEQKLYADLQKRASPQELEEYKHNIMARHGRSLVLDPEQMQSMSPTDILNDVRRVMEHQMSYVREGSVSHMQQAEQAKMEAQHIKPIAEFAKQKSFHSMGELGIYAMRQSDEKKTKRDLYLTPENIWPQMGYGSHPQELIELVQKSRKKMVQMLTEKKIEDPSGRTDQKGKAEMIDNPYYQAGMSKERAAKEAENHIKATLDTQHLGMWRRHFVEKPGETKADADKRFNKWYMEQVKDMGKKGILGNIHVVDGFGKGHTHAVAGQGIFPVVEAVQELKKMGYDKAISSEAHGDIQNMLTGTWAAFGAPTYAMGKPGAFLDTWTDVEHSYFGRTGPPNYIVGEYRPNDDWTLWSGTPME